MCKLFQTISAVAAASCVLVSSARTTLVTVLGLPALILLPSFAAADSHDYVYKQSFMPRETVELDLTKTAMFVTDPQNDFLSEGSPAWGLVGPTVIKHKVVEKEKALKALAKELGVPVFYSCRAQKLHWCCQAAHWYT